MHVESIVIALVFLIVLAMAPPSMYPLVAIGGFLTACWRRRSRFADGDLDDMKIGQALDAGGQFAAMSAVPHDLDSSADIDAVMGAAQAYDGDELLKNQMKHVGEQAQDAIVARSRFTSDNFRGLFQEELDAGEARDWWEDDNLAAGSRKDDQNWESDTFTP